MSSEGSVGTPTLRWRRLLGIAAAVTAGLGAIAIPAAAEEPVEPEISGVAATFEGTTIDLAQGWGAAGACYSEDPGSARCYRTEAEMDAAEGLSGLSGLNHDGTGLNLTKTGVNKAKGGGHQKSGAAATATGAAAAAPLATCSTIVRLYRGTLHTGGVLALSTRGVYLNLASYGFNNDTSSYVIGACASRFYDTTSGGTLYPGNTAAGASVIAMLSGWDNRVGSIYII